MVSPMVEWADLGGIAGILAALYTAWRVPAIERLKAELATVRAKSDLLYHRRLEVLSELYGHLGAVEGAAQVLMKPIRAAGEETEEESAARFVREFSDLRDFFVRQRLFVPAEEANDTESLILELATTVRNFFWYREHEDKGVTGNWPGWEELWAKVRDELPSLRRALEKRFRELLEPPNQRARWWHVGKPPW